MTTAKDGAAAHLYSEIRHSPEQIRDLFREGRYPYKTKIKRSVYEMHKEELQVELLKAQSWAKATGQRIVALFEGRDAAGKGGTIKRFTEHLNPRATRVVAREKPTEADFQRYIRHLPSAGEFVLYDRSWYNRAGVERVMGFCSSLEYLEFMRQVPDFERMLTRSGIRLFKFWFSVTEEEQRRRFDSRQLDPLKHWKLSPIDEQSRSKWQEYTQAKEAMFFYTDTADAPWTVIKSDDKRRARLNCIQYFLSELDYRERPASLGLDRKVGAKTAALLGHRSNADVSVNSVHDCMNHGQAKSTAFAEWLCRDQRLENIILHCGIDTGSVILHSQNGILTGHFLAARTAL